MADEFDTPLTVVEGQNTSTSQTFRPMPDRPQLTARDWVRDMRMSADVNKSTVGVETDSVTPDLLLATSRKLLGISKREIESDPKDSLEFQRVYSPCEYFAEHIMKDASKVARNLLWKATMRGNLDFMSAGALDQHVNDVFYSSKLAQLVDGSSPLELMDSASKVTRIGEGGVGSIDSAPVEMRLVQPSFYGFVDPIRSPESLRVGLDAYLAKNVLKGSDGKLYRKMINVRTGKEELVDSVKASKAVVTTPEMLEGDSPSVYALGGKTGVRIVDRSSVDYCMPRSDEMFSTASNLVPMPNAVKEMRLQMGCLHPMTTVLVTDRSGLVDIVRAQDVVQGMSVQSVDNDGTETAREVRQSVTRFPGGPNWFRKVTTLSGRTLITSREHRWSVIRDGKVELVTADRLRAGDRIFRSLYRNLNARRTYMCGTFVSPEVAYLLGCACRTLSCNEEGRVRMTYRTGMKETLLRAASQLGESKMSFYGAGGLSWVAFDDPELAAWLKANVGTTPKTRRVPSAILSAGAIQAGPFIDAYTHDTSLVATDSDQDVWILGIDNGLLRDGLSVVLARAGSDTRYRDTLLPDGSLELALELMPLEHDRKDVAYDVIKCVSPAKQAPVMVDLDVDDHLYACANGVVTHNSKYALQAIPLEQREAPLVRGLDEATGKDMPTLVGKHLGALFAKRPGTVTAVRQDRIDVRYDDGTKGAVSLYNNFPMNAKGYINSRPVVKAGQSFAAGDCLAASNYTDDKGVAAAGKPLRAAWISWKGGTYEDGMVISESCAKKMASTTMYPTTVDLDRSISLGKRNYQLWKPSEYRKEQLDLLDDDGVVKPGTVLHEGDPMVLAVQTTEPSPGTLGKRVLTDVSQTWEHQHPGVVTDVVKTRKGVKVLATVTAPAEVGDKMSGSYGNKGVISQILPDDQMPQDKDGNAMDILFSPLGLISRCNPAQLHETLLGKVARKTGKPEIVPAFYKGDLYQYVSDRLKQARLSATDDLHDPETGRVIPNVLNGYSYIYKLKHLSESKLSGRGTDLYTTEGTPAHGDYSGAKRYGMLETSALAGHGAFEVLKDAKVIRGQSNADFWRSLRTGQIPVMPGEPKIHRKFFSHLQGAGINVRKTAKGVSVFALTNSDVSELAGPRELLSRDTYEAKNFRPIDGGLFGQDVFGINGDKWGYIQLDEPMPNPVMEEPLQRLLNMTASEFESVVTGSGEVRGMKSASDMKAALSKVDLAEESRKAKQELIQSTKSRKDAALKRYVAIEQMRRSGVSPAEYLLDRIPVLPPEFRPITSHGSLTMVADSNYLYAQLLDARNDLRDARNLPDDYKQGARKSIYRKWKELAGLYDPENPKLASKNVQGLLAWALGSGSPKFSSAQRKIIGASVDTVGRGVIISDPRVKLNELGIPEKMAFDVFSPFIERELVKAGYTPMDALRMTKAQDPHARQVLLKVLETHPVQMNRAPTLHKLGIMGFNARLVPGNAIHINPSICVPFGADFDGDAQIGIVKVRITNDLQKLENELEKIDSDSLTNIERMLSYVLSTRNGSCAEIQGDDMYKTIKAQIRAITADSYPVILDMDLADIPHGALIRKNAGTSGQADFYEAMPGLQVLAYDEKTGRMAWADVESWSEHHGREVEIVRLGNGNDIITDDDPRAVYGIAKDAATLTPQRFTPSDALAAGVVVPCVKPGAVIDGGGLAYGYMDLATGKPCVDRPEDGIALDFGFGQFLGLLAGDGWWEKVDRDYLDNFGSKRAIYLSDNESFNAEWMTGWLESTVPGIGLRRFSHRHDASEAGRYGETVRWAFFSKRFEQLAVMLSDWLGGDKSDDSAGSKNKHLPVWTKATPAEFRRGLLCGLIATDGSVSVSHGKGKPQLMIGFASASLRMCREVRELCTTLGIRTSITFGKTTSRGNSFWQVTVSTYDSKKLDVLRGMCHTRKEEIFSSNTVDFDTSHSHGDYRPFPKCVYDAVHRWLTNPNIEPSLRAKGDTPELARRISQRTLFQSVYSYAKRGYITSAVVDQLKAFAAGQSRRHNEARASVNAVLASLEADPCMTVTTEVRDMLWDTVFTMKTSVSAAVYSTAHKAITRCGKAGKADAKLADALRPFGGDQAPYGLGTEDIIAEWFRLCDGDCVWTPVEGVEKTGRVETGYDLSVPGYETFVSSSGVVLSNTVNIHAPVSDGARRETYDKMFPEQNLIAMKDRKILYKPEKEYMQGLYVATRMKQGERPRIFDSLDDARAAQRSGIIDVDDPIIIKR